MKDEQKFFTTQSGWFLKTLTRTKESRLLQKTYLQNNRWSWWNNCEKTSSFYSKTQGGEKTEFPNTPIFHLWADQFCLVECSSKKISQINLVFLIKYNLNTSLSHFLLQFRAKKTFRVLFLPFFPHTSKTRSGRNFCNSGSWGFGPVRHYENFFVGPLP